MIGNSVKYYMIKIFKQICLNLHYRLFLAIIISWLLHSFDKIAIRQWSTYEELGLYAAAYKFVSLVAVFQVIFTTSWVPIAYKWFEEKKINVTLI